MAGTMTEERQRPKTQWAEMFRKNWYLGITSFGGPAVHFQIFRQHFVEKHDWIDDSTYQELFAICQALPGPGSTKMLYGINIIQCGFWPGLLSFFVWSVPAAIASFGLALGVSQIGDQLPDAVYALLSGLNAATVGIILLAGVQLSQKAITDQATRLLVFFSATAGTLYNALWYFPVLMAVGGATCVICDSVLFKSTVTNIKRRFRRAGRNRTDAEEPIEPDTQVMQDVSHSSNDTNVEQAVGNTSTATTPTTTIVPRTYGDRRLLRSWKSGIVLLSLFLVSFIVIMVLRGTLPGAPRAYRLFANLYLAGTIIFGGGPVVIPLLREYVVAEGWVSARDFLLGLAIIQAFPGPNFNFAVYLGGLAVKGTQVPVVAGSLIGYVGIFTPGLILFTATLSLWRVLRQHKPVLSCLRGINAAAVGLVYTAVYRLWRIGYLRGTVPSSISLDQEPWWIVVLATSFFGGLWFKIPAPIAILLGGVMGMIWYGVVQAN